MVASYRSSVVKYYNGARVSVKPGDAKSERFDLIPAIDLRGGRVVRLREGDFARETAYSDDPIEVAVAFANAGARWLHVVDLDGARTGKPSNGPVVSALAAAVGKRVRIELGGGLRTEAAVEAGLATGASRLVLGTAALGPSTVLGRVIARYGASRIAVALDVRDGLVVGEGWRQGAPGVPLADAATRITAQGVETLIVTSIRRDGGLEGPDLDLLAAVVAFGTAQVIASGGIASVADILATRRIGCGGAIVGRALYEGRIDLLEALAAIDPTTA